MDKIVLNPVTNTNSLSAINQNFTALADELRDKVLYRDNPVGGTNAMNNSLDMDGNDIFNTGRISAASVFIGNNNILNLVVAGLGDATEAAEQARLSAISASLSAATLSSFINTVTIVTRNSIGSLRADVNSTKYTQVMVSGYYVPSDGGGGLYILDPSDTVSADNYGTIIVGYDGGRWKLSVQTPISVKHFGAKGDGIADDTSSIQSAINWVAPFVWKGSTRTTELGSSGGSLFVPAGLYKTTYPLLLNAQLRMYGEGAVTDWTARSDGAGTPTGGIRKAGSCIYSVGLSAGQYAFDTAPYAADGVRKLGALVTGGDSYNGTKTQVSGVVIENLTLMGDYGCKGLNLAGVDLGRLNNVYVDGYTIGIRCSAMWYTKFDNVRVQANYRGIMLWQSVTDLSMVNTHVLMSWDHNTYVAAVNGRDGADVTPVGDLTQAQIDLNTGIVNWYSNVVAENVDVEGFPQSFLTAMGVDDYRGVYVEGCNNTILAIQGSDQQNSKFSFDTITTNTGDLLWASTARVEIDVRNHNATQAGFGKVVKYLNTSGARQYVPIITGLYPNGGDFVSARSVRSIANDYSRGGWTPLLIFNGDSAGAQPNNTGSWVRIGAMCICTFYVTVPTLSGATGGAKITELPFDPDPAYGMYVSAPLSFSYAAPSGMLARVQNGDKNVFFTNSAGAYMSRSDGFSNGCDIRGSISYIVQDGK